MGRMQGGTAAVAAAWLACMAATPARAQQQPVIRPGQTVTGTLAATDPRLSEHGAFRVYRFDARRGDRLTATMRSPDFDAYLTVARTVSGLTDVLKTDDDHGGNTDARLRFTAPADGSYLLVAQSLAEDGVGGYTLMLEPTPAPTTGQARQITLGQTVSGRLAETDAVNDEDEAFYDTWTLSARQGQRLLIESKSDSLDTTLDFGKMENGEFSSIEKDDDGGEGTNSRLRVTVPANGEYMIRASSVGATSTGPYTLVVTERPAAAAAATPTPVRAGQEVHGSLAETDPEMEDGSFYDYWTYTGRAGERIRISMSSEAFDTFVAAGTLAGGEFSEIASNDDGGENNGTNSVLEVTVPSSGVVTIRTNSLSGGETGAYTLKVESLP